MADKEALLDGSDAAGAPRRSHESDSSVSTTSIVFDRIHERLSEPRHSSKHHMLRAGGPYGHDDGSLSNFDEEDPLKEETSNDLETGPFLASSLGAGVTRMDKGLRRILFIAAGVFVAAWVAALVFYVSSKAYKHSSHFEHDPQATVSRGNAKKVTLEQIQTGFWRSKSHDISWVRGADGEDGLLLELGARGKDFLVVEDVRTKSPHVDEMEQVAKSNTLVKEGFFTYAEKPHDIWSAVPSPNMLKVLLATERQSNWRHSSTAVYWILDVGSQQVEPLDPGNPTARVQLASWSPTSDAIVFTRDNNMYLRRVGYDKVTQITTDGGAELFYGVPDWVYEEEVFSGDSATWWSEDGNYIAFLRTNESGVPDYPIQYFVSRPSGEAPEEGEENYPEVREIKYPKAGAHNPVVELEFFDAIRGDVFRVDISGDFADDDRLITTVVWAGQHVIIKTTNRISDVMRVVVVDVAARTGKAVRTVDVGELDGGWFEISQTTTYIPAAPAKDRPEDGYIDLIVHDNGDHLAYFTPMDNPEPVMITKGDWEVSEGPSAVDLDRNLVYFVATKESSVQRHVYSAKLDGSNLEPLTDTSVEGFYGASFSSGAGYALLSYAGPGIPWQKVISTPSNPSRYEYLVEDNSELADRARKHELPIKVYGTLKVDGVELNYVERRPPHFDPKKRYPVLFQQYSGPGSQSVQKRFGVDFQSYMAAGLGYVVVTVDGRGTGFIGRRNRVLVRGNLGHWESHDQIAAAQHWASLKYVDASRIAIWGWSYGGYMTLKTLEQDAGRTFRYGMAVAPVTDWRFYDSIYTERYMRTPQENPSGYDGTAVSNATALGANVRFLIMHGVADDNVHMQNTLTLLDKLDVAGIENYDVHVFPDSDHGIYFHNANKIVYDKLNNWLINAFNGEWLRVDHAQPAEREKLRREKREAKLNICLQSPLACGL